MSEVIREAVKVCKTCQAPLHKKENECNRDFEKRNYCDVNCYQNKPIPPHWCNHCGNLLIQSPKEDRCKFMRRKYCNRYCANQRNSSAITFTRWCANPGCGKLLIRFPRENPSKFAKRKYCDEKCRTASKGRCRICDILTNIQPCILCQNDDMLRRTWTGETGPEMLRLIKCMMSTSNKPPNGEEGRTWLDYWMDRGAKIA